MKTVSSRLDYPARSIFILYSVFSMLYFVRCILYFVFCILHFVFYISILHSVFCIVYIVLLAANWIIQQSKQDSAGSNRFQLYIIDPIDMGWTPLTSFWCKHIQITLLNIRVSGGNYNNQWIFSFFGNYWEISNICFQIAGKNIYCVGQFVYVDHHHQPSKL